MKTNNYYQHLCALLAATATLETITDEVRALDPDTDAERLEAMVEFLAAEMNRHLEIIHRPRPVRFRSSSPGNNATPDGLPF